jgi:hypothetical protein
VVGVVVDVVVVASVVVGSADEVVVSSVVGRGVGALSVVVGNVSVPNGVVSVVVVVSPVVTCLLVCLQPAVARASA